MRSRLEPPSPTSPEERAPFLLEAGRVGDGGVRTEMGQMAQVGSEPNGASRFSPLPSPPPNPPPSRRRAILLSGLRFLFTAAASLTLLAPVPAFAKVEVSRAWSRPAAAGTTGAGYVTLTNTGPKADALIGVTSPASDRVAAHMTMVSGGMSMMHAAPRVEIAPGASVTFAPGGYHLMFEALKKPLAPGDRLPATLRFASGQTVSASFEVRVDPPPGK
jgi:copper(I)-binding protein